MMKVIQFTSIIFFLLFYSYNIALGDNLLIHKENLIYRGAFKVPKGKLGEGWNSQSLAFGGSAIGYNPIRNSLFMMGHPYERLTVEISIPDLVISQDTDKLNTSELIQSAKNITLNTWDNLREDGGTIPNGVRPGKLLVYRNKLIGSAWAYYDGNNNAARSHFHTSLDLAASETQFSGFQKVGTNPIDSNSANGGLIGGYMAHIPFAWQEKLGGPVISGIGVIPVISRSSMGPTAWIFDPDDLISGSTAPAEMLLGYPVGHYSLGDFDNTSLILNAASEFRGLVFPNGTDSLLFFGRHGLGSKGIGNSCYGAGTSDESQAKSSKEITAWILENGTNYVCGSHKMDGSGNNSCCYDPAEGSKGVHAYPYVYQVWAYDVKDLLKVKNKEINPKTGLKYEPWDLTPYAHWNLQLPTGNYSTSLSRITGAAYDPTAQRVFITQDAGEGYGMDPFPVIHVFQVAGSSPVPKIIEIKE